MTRSTGSDIITNPDTKGPAPSTEIKLKPRDLATRKSATMSRTGDGRRADGCSYPPRGMRADRAAAYLDMSKSAFSRLVDTGQLPRAVPIGGMKVWDRLELDAAFEDMKTECTAPKVRNSMDELLGVTDDEESTRS
jgi:predicted DNA-binding transcriptional regulator AlpA